MNIKNIKFIIIAVIISANPLFSETTDFTGYMEGYALVKSIKGDIVQYVYDGFNVEKFSGEYSALSSGAFRIDYITPERQLVIRNSVGLYWYYPERELVFVEEQEKNETVSLSSLPGNVINENFSGVRTRYEGVRFYGLLKYAHVYSFQTESDNNSVYIWFEPEKRFVVRKYIKDISGLEIMKEIYHKHFHAGNVYIPSKIELFARTRKGVIHTVTEYSNIIINYKPDKRLFDFTLKKNMTVRRFNEEN